jgi:hypothetical protein
LANFGNGVSPISVHTANVMSYEGVLHVWTLDFDDAGRALCNIMTDVSSFLCRSLGTFLAVAFVTVMEI